jgi:sugar O-acyltransferase (sialic acid O-acetyltransferase NeuD family)
MTSTILWGGTGHARVLNDVFKHLGLSVVAVFDRRAIESPLADVPLFVGEGGFYAWKREWRGPLPHFAVAIGGRFGRDRLELADWLSSEGLSPIGLRHASAIVEPSAFVHPEAQVLAGAVVGASARAGRQTIINTLASLDHDSVAGDGVHLGPKATICGGVTIGDGTFIGAGATVLPFITIGRDAVVGAGSVVTRDVPDGKTVIGIPARPMTSESPS